MSNRIELGQINGAWGTAGWVKVFSLTDPPENIFEYQPWRIDVSPGSLVVRDWRRQGPRLVAQLDRIETREQAGALRGTALFVNRAQLPAPPQAQYYWHDLIGLEVRNRDGVELGRVAGLLDAGAHDVLRIVPDARSAVTSAAETTGSQGEILIPFVPGHFILAVEPDAGRIRVDWEPEWSLED